MVSVFAGNHSASRRGFLCLSRVPPTSRVFTSGYVNTEIILHLFYTITNERGTKTVFTLWPISARVLFELFYKGPFFTENAILENSK